MPEILQSKKFIATLIGIVVLVLESTVPGMVDLPTTEFVTLIVAYVIGQGVADFGKEKAKVEAASDHIYATLEETRGKH